MSLATSGVVIVAKQERKLRSGFFKNKPVSEDGMITNLSSIKMPHGAMSKSLTLLKSSPTKMFSTCRILSRVIIQGRSNTLKIKFEKLFSLKVFKNT